MSKDFYTFFETIRFNVLGRLSDIYLHTWAGDEFRYGEEKKKPLIFELDSFRVKDLLFVKDGLKELITFLEEAIDEEIKMQPRELPIQIKHASCTINDAIDIYKRGGRSILHTLPWRSNLKDALDRIYEELMKPEKEEE